MPDWIKDPEARGVVIKALVGLFMGFTTLFSGIAVSYLQSVKDAQLDIKTSTTEIMRLMQGPGGLAERVTRNEAKIDAHQRDGHPRRSDNSKSVFVDASD